MSTSNRTLGLATLGWWLAARGLSEPIEDSFTRLDPGGLQRLGKASRIATLVAARRLARALRDEPGYGGGDLFTGSNVWLDRFETLLNAPRAGYRIERALSGDAEDFTSLLDTESPADRAVMLAARLAAWLHAQVGGGDEPAALADFLAQGWPIAPGASRLVTFLDEFLTNLHAELADAPAEITMPLGEPPEFLEWLAKQAGDAGAAAKSPDLPPPVPATPPPPPVAAEPGALESGAAEPEITTPDEPGHHAAPAAELAELHAEAMREHRRLRIGAWIFQAGWLVLLFFAWRYFQQHRSAVPTAPPTPAPAATPTPVATAAAATPGATPAATIAPLPPFRPEMSVAPDQLQSQALALAAAEHHAEAVALYRRIVQLQSQDRTLGRLPRALVLARMASSLAALERWDEADASVERAQSLLEELLPAHDAETALGLEMVADYWASRERWPLAARLYQKAVQAYEDTPAENSQAQLSATNRYAGALRQLGDVLRAEQLYRRLVKAYAGEGAVVALDAASACHNLANVLLVTNRAGEAISHYEQAFAWLAKADKSDGQAKRMATLMAANFERCLGTTGLPADEARERVRKALGPLAQ